MSETTEIAGAADWGAVAEDLARELERADAGRAPQLLHALFRVLADRLGRTAEGRAHLDAAIAREPEDPDLALDAFRASVALDSRTRVAALERLAAVLRDPEDVAAVDLAIAHLKASLLDDAVGADMEIAAAEQAAPESRNLALHGLLRALGEGDDREALAALLRAAGQTGDARWRAALEAELAHQLASTGAPLPAVEEALGRIVAAPPADYAALSLAWRGAAARGLHDLAARALERLSEAALSTAADPGATASGLDWDGFSRGGEIAAAYLWSAALIRERRLGDAEGALETLRRARRLSSSRALASEESRLLFSLGRPAEALEALPEEAAPAWRSLVALAARRDEEAAGSAQRTSCASLREALVAAADTPLREADSIEAAVGDPLAWLHAHPGHPDAPARAAELLRDGEDVPYGEKLCLEAAEERTPWPTERDREGGGPWVQAVDAVNGPYAGTPTAYLEWAARTASDGLAAELRRTAARAAEDAGELERALEIAKTVAPGAPRGADFALTGRLLRKLGRREELAAFLREAADAGPDGKAPLLHERSLLLEYRLGDPAGAAADLREAIGAEPAAAPDASFARLRLALRASDLADAVVAVEEMIPGAGPEAPRLHLLAGELCLFGLGLEEDASRHFVEAASLGGALGAAARLHLSAAHVAKGRMDALEGLRGGPDGGDGALDRLWTAVSLEGRRAAAGPEGVRELLDAKPHPRAVEKLWRAMIARPGELEQRLRDLPDAEHEGPLAGACGLVADALAAARGDFAAVPAPGGAPEEPESLLGQAEIALGRAEELEAEGKPAEALELLRQASATNEAHPGILWARARIARALGSFAEAADNHGRLAGWSISRREKAEHLTRAAAILFDNLGNAEGAERIVREALKRAPGHEEANEVLTRVLRARGDAASLAKQTEQQISSLGPEADPALLVPLCEEHADRLLAVDDVAGAIAAIDRAIELDGSRLSARRTRVDLLLAAERKEDAALEMLALAEVSGPDERRPALWRAAEFVGEQLRDVRRAQEILERVRGSGEAHPTTERIAARLFHGAGMFDEEAEALRRLADLVEDKVKRGSVLRELAKLAIESLFDPDMSEEALRRALELNPADLVALKIYCESKPIEEIRQYYDRAFETVRGQVDADPLGLESIRALAEVSAVVDDAPRAALCRDAIAILEGKPLRRPASPPGASPNAPLGPVLESITHADELRCPAAAIILDSAEITAEAFQGAEHLPDVGRSTRLQGEGEPLVGFVGRWARVIGLGEVEVHRVGFDPRGVIPAPGEIPAVAVSDDVSDLDETRARFFLARGLWRAARGHAAFAEGDSATPLRWVLALAAATLGENAALPLPTDLEMVVRARKALSRKVKKKIADPCKALLSCSPHELRAWVAATAYSADRFGVLAAGDLAGVVPLVVEETAGDAGLKLLGTQAAETIGRLPRCRELFRFVLSGPFMDLRRALGLEGSGGAP